MAAANGVPESVTAAHTPTARPTTAMPGQIQRHDTPAWMIRPAAAAPHSAPVLNNACSRTSADGLPMSRWDASAFIAVSMLPPAIMVGTSTSSKTHRVSVSASRQSSADHAKSAIHSRRRAPTRSARWAVTALDAPATATATASTTPSCPSLSPYECWM